MRKLAAAGILALMLALLPGWSPGLAASSPALSPRPATDAAWLAAAYSDLLNRPPGSADLSLAQSQLAPPRQPLVSAVLGSNEYRGSLIAAWYQSFLRRPADPGALAAFTAVLGNGGTDEQVLTQILGSTEYATNEGGGTTAGYLASLFSDLLGRAPDASSSALFAGQVQALRSGRADALLASDEYRGDLVGGWYQAFLYRTAGAVELAGWEALFRGGATDEAVLASLLGSPEYYATRGGGTDPGFIAALYGDLLGRAPDAGALSTFENALQQGATPSQVAGVVLASAEYRGDLVHAWFSNYLHRAPAAGEVASYVNLLGAGERDELVQRVILASDEYYLQRAAGSPDSFLISLYSDLLARAPAAADANSFAEQLRLLRVSEAGLVVGSDEYRSRLVSHWYLAYLQRAPDPGALASWVNALHSGVTDEQVQASLISSEEYFQTRCGGSMDRFPPTVYLDLLGRAPTAAEAGGYQAAETTLRTGLVSTLANSDEYRGGFVTGQYVYLLNRTPAPAELAGWVTAMRSGGLSDAQVIAGLAGSSEYYAIRAGDTPNSFVGDLYIDFLHRTADAAGQAAFTGQLAAGVSRSQVVLHLLGSSEYRQDLVAADYLRYLRRPADSSASGWVGALGAGASPEQVIASLVGSVEYYQANALRSQAGAAFSGVVAHLTGVGSVASTAPASAPVSIDWGDGSSGAGATVANGDGFDVIGSHSWAGGGRYTVTVSLGSAIAVLAPPSAAFQATITDAQLTLTGSAPAPIEGTPANLSPAGLAYGDTTATAAQLFARVDWGDGSSSIAEVTGASGAFAIGAGHTYAEEGKYTVHVVALDRFGGMAAASVPATVADAALKAQGQALKLGKGHLASGTVATFSDADPGGVLTDYRAMIDWGDGDSSSGTVSAGKAGGFTVAGSHRYQGAPKIGNAHRIQVTITDAGGSQAVATSSASPPEIGLR